MRLLEKLRYRSADLTAQAIDTVSSASVLDPLGCFSCGPTIGGTHSLPTDLVGEDRVQPFRPLNVGCPKNGNHCHTRT